MDVIDDAVFAKKAVEKLQLPQFIGLRMFLENQRNGEDIVTSLFYRTAALTLDVEKGTLPGEHTASFGNLVNLKAKLTESGVFRHRDMFAYADLALQTCPHLVDIVHRRFPMVFIDEMQDTSWDQESFLNRLFDGKAVMQRFGDVDQKILSDEEGAHKLTFPRPGHGSISTSKRFGAAIARAVADVRISSAPVVGEGKDAYAPILLLYATENVTKVISHFGSLVLDRLDEKAIGAHAVKAMCVRKTGGGEVTVGRHVRDYWPQFGDGKPSAGSRSVSFWSLVGEEQNAPRQTLLRDRVADVRRALVLILREAKSPIAKDIHDARALPRIAEALAPAGKLKSLTHKLVLAGKNLCADKQHTQVIELVFDGLQSYLPASLTIDDFRNLKVFSETNESETTAVSALTSYELVQTGRALEFEIGTVASMKGETHSASLLLESYGGPSKKFDVSLGLEYIADVAKKKALAKLPKTQQAQMRNLYVAMSRPTTLLCLAANENRVSTAIRDALAAKGWHIEAVK